MAWNVSNGTYDAVLQPNRLLVHFPCIVIILNNVSVLLKVIIKENLTKWLHVSVLSIDYNLAYYVLYRRSTSTQLYDTVGWNRNTYSLSSFPSWTFLSRRTRWSNWSRFTTFSESWWTWNIIFLLSAEIPHWVSRVPWLIEFHEGFLCTVLYDLWFAKHFCIWIKNKSFQPNRT